MITRQEIVHELLAARELIASDQGKAADKILKRVEEEVAGDAIDDPHGRRFK
jgi:tryptophan 2,3-dioxygenase